MSISLQSLKDAIAQVATLPLMSQERIFWVYLLSAGLLAALVYLFQTRQKKSVKGLVSYLFPKQIYSHPSAWIDFKFMLVNKLVKIACLAPIILAYPLLSNWTRRFCEQFLGPATPSTAEPNPTILVIYTLLVTLFVDLALYLGHFLQHKIKFLWEFHKVHHSAQVLYPVTVYRMHPVDDILNTFLVVVSTGLLSGVFHYWFPSGIDIIMYWKLNIIVLAFYVLGYNLRHSHVWLSYGKHLSHLVMSPAQHQIHHSKSPRHFDKNMGFMLSLWDWIFGTLHVPKDEERDELEFGLGSAEEKEFSSVWKLYVHPFRRVFGQFTGSVEPKPRNDAGDD